MAKDDYDVIVFKLRKDMCTIPKYEISHYNAIMLQYTIK